MKMTGTPGQGMESINCNSKYPRQVRIPQKGGGKPDPPNHQIGMDSLGFHPIIAAPQTGSGHKIFFCNTRFFDVTFLLEFLKNQIIYEIPHYFGFIQGG